MNKKTNNKYNVAAALLSAALLCSSSLALNGCSQNQQDNTNENEIVLEENLSSTDNTTNENEAETEEVVLEKLSNDVAGEHVIEVDGVADTYTKRDIYKTGDSSLGDEADFYGDNSAVFATNKATLDFSDSIVTTHGKHANAVFAYGEGTTVNVENTTIKTSGDCSGGLMTTGGAEMNATDMNIETSGNSSAAIRSDRGGGDVNVSGGTYTTSGTGSPVVYSTADVDVSDAEMTSTASQAVVIEGKNSVDLKNCIVSANNNTKNSDKSDYVQAVMIYQSMSGDATEGVAEFSMEGGQLHNEQGDVFFVNNTIAEINLDNAAIVNNDSEGVFMRAAAAGWGNEGKNGGQVDLKAENQNINGNIIVDNVSNLNLWLEERATLAGAINPDGQAGDVYVELEEGATWMLTADSYITSLTCYEGAIDLNGHKLYINGIEYDGTSANQGEAIEHVVSNNGSTNMQPDGNAGMNETPNADMAKPEGEPQAKPDRDDGQPPAKPDGDNGQPPAKPDGENK